MLWYTPRKVGGGTELAALIQAPRRQHLLPVRNWKSWILPNWPPGGATKQRQLGFHSESLGGLEKREQPREK